MSNLSKFHSCTSLTGGVDSSSATKMRFVGHYQIEPLIDKKFIEKNKFIRTNNMLENELMNLYLAYQVSVTNVFTTYKKY